jgi:hypothetical protein
MKLLEATDCTCLHFRAFDVHIQYLIGVFPEVGEHEPW